MRVAYVKGSTALGADMPSISKYLLNEVWMIMRHGLLILWTCVNDLPEIDV
jgi:hypothetical protein